MPRTFKITVNGTDYDVTVHETSDVTSQIMPQYKPVAQSAAPAPAPAASTASAPAASAAPTPAGADDQCAQMGGVIAAILVKQGQAVNEGDRIVELEAMKMKVPVIASRTGQVSRILVAVGDSVDKGQALVTLA